LFKPEPTLFSYFALNDELATIDIGIPPAYGGMEMILNYFFLA
jgi:hypothetical protein